MALTYSWRLRASLPLSPWQRPPGLPVAATAPPASDARPARPRIPAAIRRPDGPADARRCRRDRRASPSRTPQSSGAAFAVTVLNVGRLKIDQRFARSPGRRRAAAPVVAAPACVLARSDVLVRLAGDEFIVLARDRHGTDSAEATVETIFAALREPFSIDGQTSSCAVCAGISMFPATAALPTCCCGGPKLPCARRAASRRGTFRFYSRGNEQVRRKSASRSKTELRHAIRDGQLELHYQPKVDIATRPRAQRRSADPLASSEAWPRAAERLHPDRRRDRLILPIGEWVLRQACAQMRAGSTAGMPPVRVAVNLSAKQFRHGDLAAVVCSALERRAAAARLSRARADGKRGHARRREIRGDAAAAEHDGRAHLDRRLRHGLLEPELSAPLAARQAEDRSQLRARPDVESGRCRRSSRRSSRSPTTCGCVSSPKAWRRGATRVPARARLRPVPGLLLQPRRAGRRVRALITAAACRSGRR